MTAPTPVRKAGSVFALGLRVGVLGPDGTPATGPDGAYETDNLVKIDFTVEYRDGTEVERLNGAAKACLYYSSPPTVKRLTIDGLELCNPDPELEQLLGGGDVLLDADGRPIGYAAPEVGSDPVPNGVGIEAWSSAVADDGVDAELPYMRWVFPREFLKPQGRSISADPMAAAFEGQGNQNSRWGNGPMNDWPNESGRVFQWIRVADIPDLSANGFVAVPTATP
jgi:hypothetical protein